MAFFAVVGTCGIAGLVAGAGRDAGPPQLAELTPADIIELRFPADWTASVPAPAQPVRLASADFLGPSLALFAPYPTYPTTSVHIKSAPPAEPQVTAATTVRDDDARAKPQDEAAAKPPVPAPKPAPKPVTRSLAQSNTVLNDTQIASIKKRLKLTPDQERYWPAVEAALRNINYKKDSGERRRAAGGVQVATVDPNSLGVQQLKSAAFPLVMSFTDDQRREVRTLAHVMGLENVVSQF
jgi:hypothetical protein